uniref:Uncharacterized protein n=1 Tax=Rhizophora mucronata TaxID=61149 RepID=A0A2P2NFV5_RHIMU
MGAFPVNFFSAWSKFLGVIALM